MQHRTRDLLMRQTKTLKPIDKVSPGEITSHRAVTTVNAQVASKMSESEGRSAASARAAAPVTGRAPDFAGPEAFARTYGSSPPQARRESSLRRGSSCNRTLISSPGFSRAS